MKTSIDIQPSPRSAAVLLGLLCITSASSFDKSSCTSRPNTVSNPSPNPDAQAPDFFTVEFPTTVEFDETTIVLEVNRSWAPLGVDRFYSLVQDNYYDCAAFYRVVPNFVVQFGIASHPDQTKKWDTPIPDDPVVQSNLYSYVSYATSGPNTRTAQLFINLADNSPLDNSGFAPFARVVSGMDAVENILNPTPNNSDGLNQDAYSAGGNELILLNEQVDLIEPSGGVTPTPTSTGGTSSAAAADDEATSSAAVDNGGNSSVASAEVFRTNVMAVATIMTLIGMVVKIL